MAFKWYKKAANKGNMEAQLIVASWYANGKGVKVNTKEALRWCDKVANQKGISASDTEARNKAASNTKAEIERKIAIDKAQKEKDTAQMAHEKEVVDPLAKVAKQGNVKAQLALAKIYAIGDQEVRQNTKEALVWYKKAAKQGSDEAKEQIKLLKKESKTKKDVTEKEAKVSTFSLVKQKAIGAFNVIKDKVKSILPGKKDKGSDDSPGAETEVEARTKAQE